jgi:phage major head subunit gpT-like protein
MQTSIFTSMMRTEYMSALNGLVGLPPADHEDFTLRIDSTQRVEEYLWMSVPPQLHEYRGQREYANIDFTQYSVPNIEYDAGFKVRLRDVEDDKVNGFKLQPQQMVSRARQYPSRLLLRHLAAGKTRTGFDGSAMFADSHSIGTGDNLMAGTAAANDNVYHNIVLLVKTNPVKPLIFQSRKPMESAVLQTNEGSTESRETKELRYWIDVEMACAYGFWWDSIWLEFTDTPTLTELQTALGEMENRLRTFKMPKDATSDEDEYIHEGLIFSPETITYLCSTTIANQMRQVLNAATIVNSGAAVDNIYMNHGKLVPTAYLNGQIT